MFALAIYANRFSHQIEISFKVLMLCCFAEDKFIIYAYLRDVLQDQ